LRAAEVIDELRGMGDAGAVAGMARYGIATGRAFGVSVPDLRARAKRLGRDHNLALDLWESGFHEARILASMVDLPEKVTERQMEKWVSEFDSWDVCDGCCGNLFDRTPYAYAKASEWSRRKEEFVKRAGFVLMAELAVHDKSAPDSAFTGFFDDIVRGSTDDRNFVKKAVNWALRQIGKRNRRLNTEALGVAGKIYELGTPGSRWVASDAVRELKSEAVRRRLRSSS